AGRTVAYWLRRYGFTPAIVERAPSLLTDGYKIDVRGIALQVLRRMGIHDAVVAASTDMQGALLVDKNGKVINEMTGDAFGHRVGEDLERIPLRFEHSLHGERSSCTLLPRNRPRSVRSGAIDAEWCARRPCAGQPLLC